jgi:hypothetical protein
LKKEKVDFEKMHIFYADALRAIRNVVKLTFVLRAKGYLSPKKK